MRVNYIKFLHEKNCSDKKNSQAFCLRVFKLEGGGKEKFYSPESIATEAQTSVDS